MIMLFNWLINEMFNFITIILYWDFLRTFVNNFKNMKWMFYNSHLFNIFKINNQVCVVQFNSAENCSSQPEILI